jgi:hypothetical protein
MTTLTTIGVVYAALSASLAIILVIGGWRANSQDGDHHSNGNTSRMH